MPSSTTRHPFLNGLSRHRSAPPTILVIFGATGDLTARKLIPALYNLSVDSLLPTDFHLIGYGRKPFTQEEFASNTIRDIKEFSRRPWSEDAWDAVAERIQYHQGAYDDAAAFEGLAQRIRDIESKYKRQFQILFYVSTPPTVFKPIIENLGACGLAKQHAGTNLATKIIVEKPFGRDLSTARELNRILASEFNESQVFRIDHYLGKETVQDILVQRFANSIFEPTWNSLYVESVQITVAESLGVGSRAGYYDQSGALRDMLQNHTMQLLSLIAMEPPASLEPEDIRNEKVKLLKAIQPVKLGTSGSDVVRARYTEGLIAGERVPGYMQEEGIAPDSSTETYVAARFHINNWRWHGVPFYLRSGKRMSRRVTEIAVQFKSTPGSLFKDTEHFDIAPNSLVIQIQPDEGTTLLLNSKVPGLETRTQPVKMYYRQATTFGSNTPEAYERLILDAILNDSTLFIRSDETEASWALCTPILNFWEQAGSAGLEEYQSGSWGPLAADQLLWENGHYWRKPGPLIA